MADTEAPKYISLSVTVLADQRERLEALAAADYSNPSVVIRRILADYFARLDGVDRKPSAKPSAKPASANGASKPAKVPAVSA